MSALDEVINDESVELDRKVKLLLKLSKHFTELGDHVQADLVGKRLLEMNPDTEDTRVIRLLAWNALKLSHFDEARRRFDTILKQKPMDYDASRGLRRLNLQQGKNTEAIACGERMYSSMYSALRPKLDLIVTYIRTGELAAAEEILAEAMNTHAPVRQQQMLLAEIALTYAATNRYDLADKMFKQAVALDTDGQDMELLRSQAAFELRRGELGNAEKLINQALALDGNNPHLIILQARLYLLSKQYEASGELIEDLLENGPVERSVLELQAYQLVAEGDYRAAQRFAERTLAMDPSRRGHALLAWILIAGDLDVTRGKQLAEHALTIPHRADDALTEYSFVPSAER